MTNELFLASALLFFGVLFRWGFRVLPGEKWQFLVSIPHKHLGNGTWQGVNLTYYGLFNALAHVISLFFLLILSGAVGVSADKILCILVVLMCVCIPSSRLLARLIEKKAHTFTVGGASFVGIVLAPVAVWFVYRVIYQVSFIPFLSILAAMSVAYVIGEGVGRLACISFGCCYGKPMIDCHPVLQRIFRNREFIFIGATKKIAYASGLDGQKVFPIQAVTSTILIGSALIGMHLFLRGSYGFAFILIVIISQGWRFVSEMFRADYRGGGVLSVYQILSILAAIFALGLSLVLTPSEIVADIRSGIRSLWHPGLILFIQTWGLCIFWYSGKSRVTGSHLAFHVNEECI